MILRGGRTFLVCVAALSAALAYGARVNVHTQESTGVLDQHPSIDYAGRPTTDRVAKLSLALAQGRRSLARDDRTGYLASVLDALDVAPESQLLVFSKTGVQRAHIGPTNPRALFFNESVVVGYIPGAPVIEFAAHDAQQGVVFYTLDQNAATPALIRQRGCLSCHVSASTEYVPGMIVRSNTVGDDGSVMPREASFDVDHRTPHVDLWGGWFVTTEGLPAPYSQRAHMGNITFSGGGVTSNQVFMDWLHGSPEARGYLSPSSDTAALLAFDHQGHAINLLTRLNWEARVAASGGRDPMSVAEVSDLTNELAEYLLFVNEAPLTVALTPQPAFARHLESRTPRARGGRSFGQLDLQRRLLRYPCSYLVYSEAFDGLPAGVKSAVYRRMIAMLLAAPDRSAVLEILRETKPDFPTS